MHRKVALHRRRRLSLGTFEVRLLSVQPPKGKTTGEDMYREG